MGKDRGNEATASGVSRRSVLVGSSGAALGLGLAQRVLAAGDPVVETASGKVRGIAEPGVHVFRGVRYGETTGGIHRFMPPVKARPWAGVKDAQAYGNSCAQLPGAAYPIAAWYTKIEPVSEDCLFLNVYTPAASHSQRRPVMVWLHGGAWGGCAGSAPGFDGTHLARDNDVVVVTINHRINIFGHMVLETKDARFADSGNTGVLDMVAALQWVRDNIAGFGGDPKNVTIFGQSGGAAKVATLMAFPPARGLFHKGIMESFSGGIHLRTPDEAADMAYRCAKAAGLQRADAKAMQALPMDQLIATMKTMTDAVYPILDHRNFTHHPYDPGLPPQSANIPLMIGNAATECTWWMGSDLKNFQIEDADTRRRIGRYLSVDASETNRLVDIYRDAMQGATPVDLMIAIVTDFQFRKNTMHIADMKATDGKAPVYYYVFDWKTPVYGGVLRTPHTLEVPFVFGSTEAAVASVGTGPEVAALTRTFQSTWAAFARSGNPNNPTLPQWPAYDEKTKPSMMLGLQSRVENDPGGVPRRAMAALPAYEYAVPLSYNRA
ncbi:MAG: carboxylesterase family protein [Pseudomonadota bacterium]